MSNNQQVGKKRSQWKETWRRLKKSRNAMIGLVLIFIIIAAAHIAPFIFDYETEVIAKNISERLQAPSMKHPFGTDNYGRDILARIMYGARTSLMIGAISCLICCTSGVLLGATAGYFGGKVDDVIMRFFDILLAIPSTLLAIVLVAAFGTSLLNIIIAVGLPTLPQYVRITRASVMQIKSQEYVEAARAVGATHPQIIRMHILPNCLAPVLVQATLRVATVIADAAGLAFLGLGIPAPRPDWGGMLATGRAFLRDYPHTVLFPGLAIMATILALNLLGDGLRDALDPKLKK